jgi:hypothetical protein
MTGPKRAPDGPRAEALDGEQGQQDDDAQRHDEVVEAGRGDPRPSTAESTEMAGVIMPSP